LLQRVQSKSPHGIRLLNWFKDHVAFTSMTIVMSATNTSFLELTYCELGHLGVFQAPWSKVRESYGGLLLVPDYFWSL